MQAIMKAKPGVGAELVDVPKPVPGPNDVLVRVSKTGICGTDRHIYEWDPWAQGRIKPPVVIGHEFVGIVEEVGKAVTSVKVGERVSGEGHIGCGHCYCCRTGMAHICQTTRIIGVDIAGCFAKYVKVPESNIWKVDPAIVDDQACLFDPFGNAMYTTLEQPVSGRQVLVLGCGTIGLMAIGILRVCGADRIIAVNRGSFKRELAKKMGADVVFADVDVDAIKKETDHGVDLLLEMSGNPKAIVDALRCMRNGGEAALLGIPGTDVTVPWAQTIIFKALTLRGINGRRMFQTWYQCESLLRRQPKLIEPVITHRLPFDQFEEGVKAMQERNACKVVLDWTNAEG